MLCYCQHIEPIQTMSAKLLPFKFYLKIYQLDGRVAGGFRYLRSIGFATAKEMLTEQNKMRTGLPEGQYASADMNSN